MTEAGFRTSGSAPKCTVSVARPVSCLPGGTFLLSLAVARSSLNIIIIVLRGRTYRPQPHIHKRTGYTIIFQLAKWNALEMLLSILIRIITVF